MLFCMGHWKKRSICSSPSPPPPYEDKYRPHHVCKLDKALYEFKQALRAWYAKFTSKLTKLGFKASKAN
jgi:hypothetical protein